MVSVDVMSEILCASDLLKISNEHIQSNSDNETMNKYINHILKLQKKIDKYSFYSTIDLRNENIHDEDISHIIQHAIIKKQCSILRLNNNFITCKGMTQLVTSLDHHNNTLTELNLQSNRLFDKSLYCLVELLSTNHSKLRKLYLGSNKISNEGVLLLSNMLKTNKTLTVLWLDANRIGNEGVHYLTNVLIDQNQTLEELSLKNNQLITSLSVPYFITLGQSNSSLKTIDITQCHLTKHDYQQLTNLFGLFSQFVLQYDLSESDCILS